MDTHTKHPLNLNKEEQDELLRTCSLFPCDEKTKNMAMQFLAQYKIYTHVLPEKTLPILSKCALYLAEKSQCLYNLKGEKIHGVGLSLNQIIKTFGNIEQFVGTLKDFLKGVRMQDRQAESEINLSVKRISFCMTFHSKFEKTIKKLDFVEKVSESYGYIKTFTSFLWLLFIDARSRIYSNNQDLVENTCLLVSVFYFMIRYSIDYVRPMLFSDMDKELDKKTIIAKITEKLLDLFSIEDFETYRNVVSSFDDYFDQLVQNNIVKNTNERTDFFSPELINMNYKRLDAVYQKRLIADDLDERFFLRERLTTLTPSKLTPFARQGYNSKALAMRLKQKAENKSTSNIAPDPKEYSSHRVLNYDVCEKDLQANLAKVPPTNELKFPKNVMFSPSMARTPLICATPVTMGMQMYNYLHEKPRIAKDMTFKLRKFEPQAAKWIERMVQLERRDNFQSVQQNKTREIRFNIIYSLYKIAVEEYYSQNAQEKQVQDIHKTLIALSVETVCFVCNVINMTFKDITQILGLKYDMLLKVNDFFMRFDKSMPMQVRSHFQDLQAQIVSWDVWRDASMIETIEKYARTDYETDVKSIADSKEKLIRKILTQAAVQISTLGSELKLDDRLCEQVFSTVKYIIIYEADLLHNHHLDQMILCSFYAVCKTSQNNIKFIDIKVKYEECSQHNKSMHQELIWNVEHNGSAKLDIIKFYNSVFVPKLKLYITSLKDQTNPIRGCAPVFLLSLKQLSTRDTTQCYKRHSKMRSQFAPVNLDTPNPSYAIMAQPSQPLMSRKTINFQDQQNNLNANNNPTGRATIRHHEEQYGEEYHQLKKQKEFRDLRHLPTSQASTTSVSTVVMKLSGKRDKQLNSTPRMTAYSNSFHHNCDTEKMKFNK